MRPHGNDPPRRRPDLGRMLGQHEPGHGRHLTLKREDRGEFSSAEHLTRWGRAAVAGRRRSTSRFVSWAERALITLGRRRIHRNRHDAEDQLEPVLLIRHVRGAERGVDEGGRRSSTRTARPGGGVFRHVPLGTARRRVQGAGALALGRPLPSHWRSSRSGLVRPSARSTRRPCRAALTGSPTPREIVAVPPCCPCLGIRTDAPSRSGTVLLQSTSLKNRA